jgi:hypothetical protein
MTHPRIFVEEIFAEAGVEDFLSSLRDAHPELAYELDEIARAVRRARERLLDEFRVSAPPLPAG